MHLTGDGDEDAGTDDLAVKLKVCVVDTACGVSAEEGGVSVKFVCEEEDAGSSASKLVLGFAALVATAYAF